jgi:putative endonuclease
VKHNQRVGTWGEEIAAEYLTGQGFEIVTRNARTPYGEIDIIARQGETVVFLEVKTRTSDKMGLPEDSITARKRQHMLSAAEHYAMESEIDHWQIDVIAIEGKPGVKPKITHFENAIS